jgi:hypothetical protein
MTYLYIVRCNFTRPDLEQSWNDWYSGQKIRELLAKPMFRAVQRFRLSSGTGRAYVAIWQVASPEAFETREYTSDWGFFDWEQHVTDWSRDLFDAGGTPEAALAVSMQGLLQVISFDGLTREQADARRRLPADPAGVMWFQSVGLDRHTPIIGLRQLSDATGAQLTRPLPSDVQAGIYRPICEFSTAATLAK